MDRIEVVEGELVIVMELADKSLHDYFEECPHAGLVGIPRDTLLRYIRDAAEALDHMNEKHGLQHLDIKPRNLFLVSDRVKVADFGLVKTLERERLRPARRRDAAVRPAGNLYGQDQQPQRPIQPRHRLP
jgi:serine/threonine protein kinase